MMSMSRQPTVALALNFPDWESEFLAAMTHPSAGTRVTRRCVDVSDMSAYVATTDVDVVVVALTLPGLDAHVAAGITRGVRLVVALAADDADRERALALGLENVVTLDELHMPRTAASVIALIRHREFATAADVEPFEEVIEEDMRRLGALVIVTGPQGSAGRTTTAVTIADEAVRMGQRCLLIDADVHAGSIDQMLGITDNRACVNAMLRQLALGALDPEVLWRSAVDIEPGLRAIVGPSSARQVRPELWRRLLVIATQTADLVVVDRGVLLALAETSENLEDVSKADAVIVVGGSDPIAVARLLRCVHEVKTILPIERLCTVVSRDRGDDRAWHEFMVRRLGRRVENDVIAPMFITEDAAACAKALRQGQTLAHAAPRSRVRRDLRALTDHVLAVAHAA